MTYNIMYYRGGETIQIIITYGIIEPFNLLYSGELVRVGDANDEYKGEVRDVLSIDYGLKYEE